MCRDLSNFKDAVLSEEKIIHMERSETDNEKIIYSLQLDSDFLIDYENA